MESPAAPVVRALKKLLSKGSEHLINEVESFSSLVDDLRGYSWRLSWQEAHFLRCLLRLREELVDGVPIIFSVEDAERRHREVKSALFDQTCLDLKGELAKLTEKKREIQSDIKEDIAKLLEKRKILLELKSKQASLGGAIERLLEDLEMVKTCKLNIEGMCYEAEEAAKFL
ncbi:hypothetical protein A2U01_0027392 [Trifolium medium]|uniref:Uncharacterized protein n=1 Tax=Trifolium medium TaxID=97028 RepID=A0A392P2Q6_9FABA|nr:hypothetical protein [Trifolium medium]